MSGSLVCPRKKQPSASARSRKLAQDTFAESGEYDPCSVTAQISRATATAYVSQNAGLVSAAQRSIRTLRVFDRTPRPYVQCES